MIEPFTYVIKNGGWPIAEIDYDRTSWEICITSVMINVIGRSRGMQVEAEDGLLNDITNWIETSPQHAARLVDIRNEMAEGAVIYDCELAEDLREAT